MGQVHSIVTQDDSLAYGEDALDQPVTPTVRVFDGEVILDQQGYSSVVYSPKEARLLVHALLDCLVEIDFADDPF